MDREYFSIPEAAAMLGISRIAVFKKVKKGQLPALRVGRNWAVPAYVLAKPASSPAQPPPAVKGPRPDIKKKAEQPPLSSDEEMNSMGWD